MLAALGDVRGGLVGPDHGGVPQPALQGVLEPGGDQSVVQADQAGRDEPGRNRGAEQGRHQVRGPLDPDHVASREQGGRRHHVRAVTRRPATDLRRWRRGAGVPAPGADPAHQLVLAHAQRHRLDVEHLHRPCHLTTGAVQATTAPDAPGRLHPLDPVRVRDPLQAPATTSLLTTRLTSAGPAR